MRKRLKERIAIYSLLATSSLIPTSVFAAGNPGTLTDVYVQTIGTNQDNYVVALGETASVDTTEASAGNNNPSGVAIGYNAVSHSRDSITIGSNVTTGLNDTTTQDRRAIAIGVTGDNGGTAANREQSIAIGTHAVAGDPSAGAAYANNEIAIGTDTQAYGQSALTIGHAAKTTGSGATRAVALGANTVADYYSVAVGGRATATGAVSVAIGGGSGNDAANASLERSVALGIYATTTAGVSTESATVTSTDGSTSITYGNFAGQLTGPKGSGQVLSVGRAGIERQIQNVAAGQINATSTDAINGSQLFVTNQTVANVAGSVKNIIGAPATVNNDGTVSIASTGIANTGASNVNDAISAARTTVTSSDNTVNVIDNEANGAHKYDLQVNTGTLRVDNGAVTADADNGNGAATTNNSFATVQDVADAINNVNAVNNNASAGLGTRMDGIDSRMDGFDHRMNKMDKRIDKVGAGAAALAALHPLDFNPDAKWDFAAGYGNYAGANAMAVGAYYRPNEDTMFSVGGSMGNGENMVNAGLSLKIGGGNSVSRSKVAMAKEIEDLKSLVTKLVDRIDAQDAQIASLQGQPMTNVNFPDLPKDHWAYNYVKTLADHGLLVGYPDGEFKGDRTMTRYEFATVIYRALENGALVDNTMKQAMSEFAPEIEKVRKENRFRVDRISGKDNDRHKVERIRINAKSDKENQDYRDVYGSKIEK